MSSVGVDEVERRVELQSCAITKGIRAGLLGSMIHELQHRRKLE